MNKDDDRRRFFKLGDPWQRFIGDKVIAVFVVILLKYECVLIENENGKWETKETIVCDRMREKRTKEKESWQERKKKWNVCLIGEQREKKMFS